ncbi:hypothetical protein OPIT5_00315 (plasmid) [Opitutaceae bacterium TAV5]|nr:hypothetical protein OPIT5_00315 [Opitutaceae bacterium TAV5]
MPNTFIPLMFAAFDVGGYSVSTKTVVGWVIGLALILGLWRCLSLNRDAANDRDAEQRNEKLKMAWVVLGSSVCMTILFERLGFISFTEITSSLNNF